MENEVKLSLLRLRAQSYYKLDRFTGKFFLFYLLLNFIILLQKQLKTNSLADMWLVLNENDDLFLMYQ
jgi:hypothetical protein